MDLINNPSALKTALIDNWNTYCAENITQQQTVTLTQEIRRAIDGFDFAGVEHLTAPMLVKDPAAGPALSKVLGLMPDEAPPGEAPQSIQPEEAQYVDQLCRVYGEASPNYAAGLADVA